MTDTRPSEPQITDAVMMIRPLQFHVNPLTAATNHFQHSSWAAGDADAQQHALAEFDGLCHALVEAGVEVIVFEDSMEHETPDALFPNNWITFHYDGTAVLYPMMAENRRLERRPELIESLARHHGFDIRKLIDLSGHELQGRFLEGTGSVVLDRVNRIAYACYSGRTHAAVLEEFGERLGYEIVAFHACDADGVAVYHTNVMMNVGENYAVICADAISDAGARAQVLERLQSTDHEIIEIDQRQMAGFAGNVLGLRSRAGHGVLAMSRSAYQAFDDDQRARLEACTEIVAAPIDTIEWCGGGSVRCMLAEIHLPRSKS